MDPGPGRTSCERAAKDVLELVDGELDFIRCTSTGPAIEADALDALRSCAPRAWLRTCGFDRRGAARIFVRSVDTRTTVACSGRVSL